MINCILEHKSDYGPACSFIDNSYFKIKDDTTIYKYILKRYNESKEFDLDDDVLKNIKNNPLYDVHNFAKKVDPADLSFSSKNLFPLEIDFL